MADDNQQEFTINAEQGIRALQNIVKAYDATDEAVIRLIKTVAQLDDSNNTVLATFKGIDSQGRQVAATLKRTADGVKTSGSILEDFSKKSKVLSDDLLTLSTRLVKVALDTDKLSGTKAKLPTADTVGLEVKSRPTDILSVLPSDKRKGLTGDELSVARNAANALAREIERLNLDTDTLDKTFQKLGQNKLGELPPSLTRLISLYLRVKEALDNVGASARASEKEQKRVTDVPKIKDALTKQFDITGISASEKELKRLSNAIDDVARHFVASGGDLNLFNNTLRSVAAGNGNLFTGVQGQLATLLTRVKETYGQVGNEAKKAADKEIAEQERVTKITQARDITSSIIPIPTGVAPKLENQLRTALTNIGKEAVKTKTDLADLPRIIDSVLNNRTDFLGPKLEAVRARVSALVQIIDKANAPVKVTNDKAVSDFANQARTEIEARLTPIISPKVDPSAALKLESAYRRAYINIGSAAQRAGLDASQLSTVINAALNNDKTTLPLSMEKVRLKVDDLIKSVNAFGTANKRATDSAVRGAEKLAAAEDKTNKEIVAGVAERTRNLVEQVRQRSRDNAAVSNLGNLQNNFNPNTVKPTSFTKSDGSVLSFLAQPSISAIERVQKDFEEITVSIQQGQFSLKQFNDALAHVQSGDRSIFPPGAAEEARQLATKLIKDWGTFDKTLQSSADSFVAGEKAKEAAALRTAAATQRQVDAANEAKNRQNAIALVPDTFDKVKNAVTNPSTGFGPLPTNASLGDVEKIRSGFASIVEQIALGKVSLDQFNEQLDIVRNKKITAPTNNGDIEKLRKSLTSLGLSFKQAGVAATEYEKAIITSAGAMRLFISQVAHSILAKFITETREAIGVTKELSIQIGLIQTITQDAVSSSDQWGASLRRVSDSLGVPIVEAATAAYDALSNQITRGQADTEQFLSTAIAFGRTVGANSADSVNLLSAAINAYGLSLGDADKAAANFFTTIDFGRVKANELANTYGRTASLASFLGVSMEETNAALASLTLHGLQTHEAYTLLNNVFVKLAKPTQAMSKLFDELGVASGQELVRLKGFPGVLAEIEKQVSSGNIEFQDLFNELRALRGILGLTGEQGRTFSSILKEMKTSTDNFNKAKELTQEPFGKQLNDELNKLKNFFTEDVVKDFTKGFLELNNLVGGFYNRIRDLYDLLSTKAILAGAFFAGSEGATLAITGMTALAAAIGTVIAQYKAGTLAAFAFSKVPLSPAIVVGQLVVAIATLRLMAQQARRDMADANKTFQDSLIEQGNAILETNKRTLNSQTQAIKESVTNQVSAYELGASRIRQLLNGIARDSDKSFKTLSESAKNSFELVFDTLKEAVRNLDNELKAAINNQKDISKAIKDNSENNAGDKFRRDLDAADSFARALNFNPGVSKASLDLIAGEIDRLNKAREEAVKSISSTDGELGDTSGFEKAQEALKEITDRYDDLIRRSREARIAITNNQITNAIRQQQQTAPGGIQSARRHTIGPTTLLDEPAIEKELNDLVAKHNEQLGEQQKLLEQTAKTRQDQLAKEKLDLKEIEDLGKKILETKLVDEQGKLLPNPTGIIDDLQKAQSELLSKLTEKAGPKGIIEQSGLLKTFLDQKNDLEKQLNTLGQAKLDQGKVAEQMQKLTAAQNSYNESLNATAARYQKIVTALEQINAQINSASAETKTLGKGLQVGASDLLDKGTLLKPRNPFSNFVPESFNPITSGIGDFLKGKGGALTQTDDIRANIKTQVDEFNALLGDLTDNNKIENALTKLTQLENTFKDFFSIIAAGNKDKVAELFSRAIPGANGQSIPLIDSFNTLRDQLDNLQLKNAQQSRLNTDLSRTQAAVQLLEGKLNEIPPILRVGEDAFKAYAQSGTETFDAIIKKIDLFTRKAAEANAILNRAKSAPDSDIPNSNGDSIAPAPGFAKGGLVPNITKAIYRSRNGDTVPAMLRPNEFVVTQEGTAKYYKQLMDINSGKTPIFPGSVHHTILDSQHYVGFDSPELNKNETINQDNRKTTITKHEQIQNFSNNKLIKQLMGTIKEQNRLIQFPKKEKQQEASVKTLNNHTTEVINNVSRTLSNANINVALDINIDKESVTKKFTPKYYASGGLVDAFLSGAYARGTDTIPAMLTRGEYVVDAATTKKFYPQLLAMSRGITPQYYASGGLVGMSHLTSLGGNQNIENINVSINGDARQEGLGRRIGQEISREIRRGNLRFKR